MNIMFIALGRHHGVCHIGSLVSKHILPRFKSKDLFIGSTRRQIGAREHATHDDPADRTPSKGGFDADGAVRMSSISVTA